MLILLAHGSRDPHWRGSVQALADEVRAHLASEHVRIAFMQFEGPALPDVVEEAARAGHETLRLLPLFMASAGHVDKDIKPLVAELSKAYPQIRLDLLTPVGEDPHFPHLIVDIVTDSGLPS